MVKFRRTEGDKARLQGRSLSAAILNCERFCRADRSSGLAEKRFDPHANDRSRSHARDVHVALRIVVQLPAQRRLREQCYKLTIGLDRNVLPEPMEPKGMRTRSGYK